jgi:hypothetical protein
VLVIPNPVREEAMLLLKVKNKISLIEILDITGRSLLTMANPSENNPIIKTEMLPSGVYIIAIRFEDGDRITSKFIRQ